MKTNNLTLLDYTDTEIIWLAERLIQQDYENIELMIKAKKGKSHYGK